MSLAKGDHLVIKRDGKIVEGEMAHEFEVMDQPSYVYAKSDDPDQRESYAPLTLRIVK